MKKLSQWIFPALTVMLVAFIFWNSFQDADASNAASDNFRFLFGGDMFWIRKSAHFAEYFLLGVLLALDVRKKEIRRLIGWLIVAALLVALTDETIQYYAVGRSSEVWDVWIDTVGAGLGVAAAAWIICKKRK